MLKNNPLVSVIIPVYNMADRLRYMIQSLQKQDYDNLEVIVYDDASDDSVADELEKLQWAKSFSRVHLIRGEENRGESYARNRGCEASNGEFIVFLDADDLVAPNFISALFTTLQNNDCDYSACGYQTLELSNGAVGKHPLKVSKGTAPGSILTGLILNRYELCQCAILYRKKFLLENNLSYTENCTGGADGEFLMKMCCCEGRGAFIEDCLYSYVYHPQMGSRLYIQNREKKIQRYHDHTMALIRQALWVKDRSNNQKACYLAKRMLFPSACQRILSLYAMRNDRARYDKLLKMPLFRRNLSSAWRSFFIKPEVFLRSCIALYFPGLYWYKYSHYV